MSKQISVKILNPKHNKATQELLFKHGFCWSGGETRIVDANNYIHLYYGSLPRNSNKLTHGTHIEYAKIMRLKELKEYLNENSN